MTPVEPTRAAIWTLAVDAPEGARISDLCDAVAAHGDVLSVEFKLRGGFETTAVALRARSDVVEVVEFVYYEV